MSCGPKRQTDWTATLAALSAILDALTTHPTDATPVALAGAVAADLSVLLRRGTRVDHRISVRNSGVTASTHCAISRTAPAGGDLGGP